MHPAGIALCVMAGLFVLLVVGLIVKSLLDRRRPDFSDPAQMLAHHVSLLKHHHTGEASFLPAARKFAEMFASWVPPEGPADSIQGEVIRSVDRLASEERRNGNGNWNSYYRRMT